MRRFFLKLFRRRRLEQDLQAELAFHREMADGHHNPIPLGNTAVIHEQARDLWRFNFVENLWRDLVYAVRGLRRSPALVAIALLSLGMGIGVNTAMFSLGVAFLFSEPSVRDAASVASVRLAGSSHAPPEVVEFVRASGLFQDVVGVNEEVFANYNDGAETHRAFSVYTTKNYFTALGVPMQYGRGILPTDPDEVAVLGDGFWRKYFGGDPGAVGRTINLDGRVCTVVGILPREYQSLLGFGYTPEVYMPRYLKDTMLQIYGRLRPGMTLAEARAGLFLVASRLDAAMPEPWKYAENIEVTPVTGFAHGNQKTALTIGVFFALLLAVVGLVLVIACINVAGLLLARASARRREISIRLALGAGRGRLLQQLLAESLLLSLLGAGLGLALAQGTGTLLAGIRLPLPIPIRLQAGLDWRAIFYAALLTTFATLACGLLPAWQSLRESIAPSLQRDARLRLRRVLVGAQIATSVVVLATGFLFMRNLVASNAISPGFDVRRTLRADVYLPPAGYSNEPKKAAYIDTVLRELGAVPGIESAAAARIVPFTDNTNFGTPLVFSSDGAEVQTRFQWNAVTPSFFTAMDIPIRQGRAFSDADRGGKVVIVNRTFVERYLGSRQPVGTVFLWGREMGKTPYRIVGVADDTKTITIGEDPQPQLYEPLSQIENDRLRIQFVMRSAIPPALQIGPVRAALRRIEPMAGAQVETMFSSIGLAFLPSQIGAALLGSLGVLGLVLAAIGLYGVIGYSVVRRTREIGIRIAVGASHGDIVRMVLRESAKLTVAGSAAGLLLALFVTKPLAMFLAPGLKPADPVNFAAVALLMVLTGMAAAWGPVRRAVNIDPNAALRDE